MKTRRYKKIMRKKHTRKGINRRRNVTKKRKEVFVRNNNVTRRKSLNGGELNDKQSSNSNYTNQRRRLSTVVSRGCKSLRNG